MPRPVDPQSRTRLLNEAERLFDERGYHAVSMADIAKAVGIKKPSLYYHVPGGKEELFVEVSERSFKRHQLGLSESIAAADDSLEAQLQAAARWLIAQAPLGLLAMMQNGTPGLKEENAAYIESQRMASLWAPLHAPFETAKAKGEITISSTDTAVGAFLSIMDGVTHIGSLEGVLDQPMEEVADELIHMMLYGIGAS